MPKKTKKQKIISDYRKKLNAISASVVNVSPITTTQTPLSPVQSTISIASIKPSVYPTQEVQNLVAVDEFTAIKKDLFTTLILTSIILIGELIVARYIRF